MSLPPIASIKGVQPTAAIDMLQANKPSGKSDNLFAKMLQGANEQQKMADLATEQLATGQSDSVHNTVLSAAKADLSFRLVLEVRNKLIDAYTEIMRMQV